jgi:Na+:H+ antiporter, NhaC family
MMILITTFLLIGLGVYFLNTALIGLFFGSVLSLVFCLKSGFTMKESLKMIFLGIQNAKIIVMIMSLIGVLSALWMASGTMATLMDYGFSHLLNFNLVLSIFVITGVFSLILGTSIGTLSVLGIPLMEIGTALGIPPGIIGGALVSGIYIGDRISPISSSLNLNASMTGTLVIDNIKTGFKTIGPVILFSAILYGVIGRGYVAGNAHIEKISVIKDLLSTHFHLSLISLVPVLLLTLLAVMKVKIVYGMMISILSTVLLILAGGNTGFTELFSIMVYGFHPENPALNEVISGGGFLSMINVILVIVFSTGFSGILEHSGGIKPLIERFSNRVKRPGQLVGKTSLLAFSINLVTCNQSLSLIIPGRFLPGTFEEKGLTRLNLSRTLGDTGVVTVPLIPWNVNAIAIVSIIGVSTFSYAPYAFLCLLLPFYNILHEALGQKNKPLKGRGFTSKVFKPLQDLLVHQKS